MMEVILNFPVAILQALLNVFPVKPSQLDNQESNDINDWVESTASMATFGSGKNIEVTLLDFIYVTGHSDPQYRKGFQRRAALLHLRSANIGKA